MGYILEVKYSEYAERGRMEDPGMNIPTLFRSLVFPAPGAAVIINDKQYLREESLNPAPCN